MALLFHIWEVQLDILACRLFTLMYDLFQPVQANVMIVPEIMCQLLPSTDLLSDAAQAVLLRACVNKSHF
jgi:hypothetical protein